MLKEFLVLLFCITVLTGTSAAQFNSGSTGADGALDLLNICGSSNVCEVQVPESGVLNYTTINIPGTPTHRTLTFRRNSRNTPVIVLAQGNVVINGLISVAAPSLYPAHSTQPGTGGFSGGQSNGRGFGPGGGQNPGESGRWVGPLSLQPIVGGSGGAGNNNGVGGGGGGGAIVIASSTSISVGTGGQIAADGIYSLRGIGPGGNLGSGGAIRLIANHINIAGLLSAATDGATCSASPQCGVIRLETDNLIFSGTSTPLATHAAINPIVVSSASPRLTISSVGGFSVPSNSGSRFDLLDLLLPTQLPDPVSVVVGAQNIPTGAQVQVGFVSGSPNATSSPCNLTGTFGSSSCTATISNLNRTGGTYLLATAIFDPPASLARFNQEGPNRVARVKLESVLGSTPKYVFLRSDDSLIDIKTLSKEFLMNFGM